MTRTSAGPSFPAIRVTETVSIQFVIASVMCRTSWNQFKEKERKKSVKSLQIKSRKHRCWSASVSAILSSPELNLCLCFSENFPKRRLYVRTYCQISQSINGSKQVHALTRNHKIMHKIHNYLTNNELSGGKHMHIYMKKIK